jgi:transcriptional regulator with XRE-family HTH domain
MEQRLKTLYYAHRLQYGYTFHIAYTMKRGEVRRIARETQLSASTVSRVLRGVVKPRWETKIKIDKAKDQK